MARQGEGQLSALGVAHIQRHAHFLAHWQQRSDGAGNRVLPFTRRGPATAMQHHAARSNQPIHSSAWRQAWHGRGFQHLVTPAEPRQAILMRQHHAGKKIAQIKQPRDLGRGRAGQHFRRRRGL